LSAESKDLVFGPPFVIPSETRNLLPAGCPRPRAFQALGSLNSTTARDAENADEGPNPTAIHQSFMKSPHPRANILDPDMDSAAIGIAEHNGQMFGVEDFSKAR
jgi:hypothetical protein